MKHIALLLIRAYRLTLSRIIGHHCRFHPTCSDYTYTAISRYGAAKGIFLGIKRLLKCHPFHPGGVDLVP